MSNNTGNVLTALLTGAVVGAGIGILYAPDKGKKTRKKIKKSAVKAKDDISQSLTNAKEEFSKSADAKKVEFEEKLEDTLSNMSYKADEGHYHGNKSSPHRGRGVHCPAVSFIGRRFLAWYYTGYYSRRFFSGWRLLCTVGYYILLVTKQNRKATLEKIF